MGEAKCMFTVREGADKVKIKKVLIREKLQSLQPLSQNHLG